MAGPALPVGLDAIVIVKPETVIGWHRRGFRAYWRWKSRRRGGRPKIDRERRSHIRQMNSENPLWGAPRIHGELLMLGIDISQSARGQVDGRVQATNLARLSSCGRSTSSSPTEGLRFVLQPGPDPSFTGQGRAGLPARAVSCVFANAVAGSVSASVPTRHSAILLRLSLCEPWPRSSCLAAQSSPACQIASFAMSGKLQMCH